MALDSLPPASPNASGSRSVPLGELKAVLKDSLVEVLRENPALLHSAPELASCSSEPLVLV